MLSKHEEKIKNRLFNFVTKKRSAWQMIMTISLLLSFAPIRAQNQYQAIYTNFGIINVSWMRDGSSLTFQDNTNDTSPVSVENNWHAYNVDRNSLSTGSLWPLPLFQPQGLPRGLKPLPPIATDSNGRTSFTFLSPNNRYLIYAAERSNGDLCWPLVLADIQKIDFSPLENISICNLGDFANFLSVHWSQNDAAFTIYTSPGSVNLLYYVTNYMENIENTTITHMEILSSGDTAVDLSTDGSKVLGIGAGEGQLFIWDSNNPSEHQIIGTDNQVIEGQFASDDHQIWYIGKDGLQRFDLTTNDNTVLNSELNSTWVNKAWFSPDGKHIALYEKKGLQENNLYIVDVPTG